MACSKRFRPKKTKLRYKQLRCLLISTPKLGTYKLLINVPESCAWKKCQRVEPYLKKIRKCKRKHRSKIKPARFRKQIKKRYGQSEMQRTYPSNPPKPIGLPDPRANPAALIIPATQTTQVSPTAPAVPVTPISPDDLQLSSAEVVPTVTRYFYIPTESLEGMVTLSAERFTDDLGKAVKGFPQASRSSYNNLFINGMLQEGRLFSLQETGMTMDLGDDRIWAGTPVIVEHVELKLEVGSSGQIGYND